MTRDRKLSEKEMLQIRGEITALKYEAYEAVQKGDVERARNIYVRLGDLEVSFAREPSEQEHGARFLDSAATHFELAAKLTQRIRNYRDAARYYAKAAELKEEHNQYLLGGELLEGMAGQNRNTRSESYAYSFKMGQKYVETLRKKAKSCRREAALETKTERLPRWRKWLVKKTRGLHIFLFLLLVIFFFSPRITGNVVGFNLSSVDTFGIIFFICGAVCLLVFIVRQNLLRKI